MFCGTRSRQEKLIRLKNGRVTIEYYIIVAKVILGDADRRYQPELACQKVAGTWTIGTNERQSRNEEKISEQL